MSEIKNCPICNQDITHSTRDGSRDIIFINCRSCGEYGLTRQGKQQIETVSNIDKAKVSSYLRERNIRGDNVVTLVSDSKVAAISDIPIVGIDDIINVSFPKNVSERLERSLQNLHRLSPHPGASVDLTPEIDSSVLFAENKEVFFFIIDSLYEEGLITKAKTMQNIVVALTTQGWNRIAELEREQARISSTQAFVALWFESAMEKPYEDGIKKAIESAGYQPLRMDLKEHNEKICDAIIAEIRKSRFMIADFTGHRGGVYFEAGYALGLGIPVIWTCKEDALGGTHFDTRQYNHIVWKDEKDLFEQLRRRIEATIHA